MDKEFWKMIGAFVVIIALGMSAGIWMISKMLEDVTVEGLAEEAGRATTQIERAFERGRSH